MNRKKEIWYSNTDIEFISLQAKLGKELRDVIKDGLITALTENEVVRVTHDGNIYEIDPNFMIECIINWDAQK